MTGILVVGVATAAWAAPPKGQQPGGHLRITEVLVDFGLESITIVVEDLDFGPGPFEVTLGDAEFIGDITSLCTENLASTPQTMACDFSTTGLPAYGDYLLGD